MIKEYFEQYAKTTHGFKQFHNEVINVPRDEHTNLNLHKLQKIAARLLTLPEEVISKEMNYKEILQALHQEYLSGKQINPRFHDPDFEERYLELNNLSFDRHYQKQGRMFRHVMGFALLFGLLESVTSRTVRINKTKCKEYISAYVDIEHEYIRNEILAINIKHNGFIKRLNSINLTSEADYSPAEGIIQYIQHIDRPVSAFELSVLLGRIDDVQTLDGILERALAIGRTFPSFILNEQIHYFFTEMEWVNPDESLFQYSTSQEPYFKFKSFLNFLVDFDLLNYNTASHTYTLTTYAKELATDTIPFELADLQELLAKIESTEVKDSELKKLILVEKRDTLLEYLKGDPNIIVKLGKRSLRSQRVDNNGRRLRNPLIIEFAKIRNDHKCHVITYTNENNIIQHRFNQSLFSNNHNVPYCEGHHIIEFGNENGPDIIENILLVDPNTHMLVHHGNREYRDDLFRMLRQENIITLDRFKSMITNYNCLTEEHIDILKNKSLIYRSEAEQLKLLIQEQS